MHRLRCTGYSSSAFLPPPLPQKTVVRDMAVIHSSVFRCASLLLGLVSLLVEEAPRQWDSGSAHYYCSSETGNVLRALRTRTRMTLCVVCMVKSTRWMTRRKTLTAPKLKKQLGNPNASPRNSFERDHGNKNRLRGRAWLLVLLSRSRPCILSGPLWLATGPTTLSSPL